MKHSAIFWAIFAVAIWGINPALSKLGMIDMPPFAFLSLRYLLTGLIFLPFAKIKTSELPLLFLFALFHNIIMNGLCYVAFELVQPAAATLLMQTGTPISMLMACMFAKEKMSLRQNLGIIAAFCGIFVILGFTEISLFGAALILLSRIFWGACQLIFKQQKNVQASAFLASSSLFSVPFSVIISFILEDISFRQFSQLTEIKFCASVAFQVLGLSAATVIWQKLIAENGVNKINPYALLEIVFSILAGYIVFGDTVTWRIGLGICMVTGGIFFGATGRKTNDSQS